jgi:hypothetical protein
LLRNRSRAAKTKINLTNADALKTLEVLTPEISGAGTASAALTC